LIADEIGFDPQSTPTERRGWWRSISTGDYSGDNFVWIMRPQLADALVQLEMVDTRIDGAIEPVDPDIPEGIIGVEGRLLLRSHLARERDRSLIVAKRRLITDWRCEVCSFSFEGFYGIAFCEVHHLVPVSSLDGTTPTRLEDLAIVCANCHRIIHLSNPPLTLEQLRTKINKA
jgi:5-methylcytosine-specific restriction protein A